MARPIRETPILFGEDARRFEENMRNAKCTITRKEYEEMMASYRAVLAALERGEASEKARLAAKAGAFPRIFRFPISSFLLLKLPDSTNHPRGLGDSGTSTIRK